MHERRETVRNDIRFARFEQYRAQKNAVIANNPSRGAMPGERRRVAGPVRIASYDRQIPAERISRKQHTTSARRDCHSAGALPRSALSKAIPTTNPKPAKR